MKTPRTPIADIRRAMDASTWTRNDLTGGTPEEYRRQDIPARLAPHLERLRSLAPEIPERFAEDRRMLQVCIERCEEEIARWHAKRFIFSLTLRA